MAGVMEMAAEREGRAIDSLRLSASRDDTHPTKVQSGADGTAGTS
jgi:hypothetical protein